VTPSLRARPARSEKAAILAALFSALNRMDGPLPPVTMSTEAIRHDLLGPGTRAMLLAAEFDGRFIDSITGNPVYDSVRAVDTCVLNDLCVLPESQQCGANCLWSSVDLDDENALRCYQAFGAGDGSFVGRIPIGPTSDAMARQGTE
jgi:hypothetical protein